MTETNHPLATVLGVSAPTHVLVAVIDDLADATEALAALHAAGLADAVELWRGPQFLENSCLRSGP
jgi:hypothetical protein